VSSIVCTRNIPRVSVLLGGTGAHHVLLRQSPRLPALLKCGQHRQLYGADPLTWGHAKAQVAPFRGR
jgi:hypothetical protein